mgnify:CR=1 FL=1
MKWTDKREKLSLEAKKMPDSPGVYLLQDSAGGYLYIGKANSLRKRVGSYFLESTNLGPWKQGMLELIRTVEVIECQTEWEALLLESRLIKDHRPKYNTLQLDNKTYPYLVVTKQDDFPGVFITRNPTDSKYKKGKIFGPFTSVGSLNHAVSLLQMVFKYRTCELEIRSDNPELKFFRPCLLYAVNRCSAPCAGKVDKDTYRKSINQFIRFLTSKRSMILKELEAQMKEASLKKNYEQATIFREQIKSLQKLDAISNDDVIWQSEVTVFAQSTIAGMKSLRKTLGVDSDLRFIEAFDIAHLQGSQTVAAKVAFVDGRPYKDAYRRYKIETSTNDDYMSMREVISRRYRDAGNGLELYPDLIVIDGGKGQLSAALEALEALERRPPLIISLAKKEELIYCPGRKPIRLSRNNEGLKLVQSIRDEAHRFARHYHHYLRKQKLLGEKPSDMID